MQRIKPYVLSGLSCLFTGLADHTLAQKFQAEWINETHQDPVVHVAPVSYALEASALTVALSGLDSVTAKRAQVVIADRYHFYQTIIGTGNLYTYHEESASGRNPLTFDMTIDHHNIAVDIMSPRDSTHIDLKGDRHKPGHFKRIETQQRLSLDESTSIEMQKTYRSHPVLGYELASASLKVIEKDATIAVGSSTVDDTGSRSSQIELRQPVPGSADYQLSRLYYNGASENSFADHDKSNDYATYYETFLNQLKTMVTPKAREYLQPFIAGFKRSH